MTIFSKIIAGKYLLTRSRRMKSSSPSSIFSPLVEGHTLVIPKIEIDKLFDVPDEYLFEMLVFAKPIAKAIEKAFPCNRCGLAVVGLEVPHAHIHLVPLNSINDINFTKGKLKLKPEQLKAAQEKIMKNLQF